MTPNPTPRLRAGLLGLVLTCVGLAFGAGPLAAAEPAKVPHVPPPQTVLLRVQVGADGKVLGAKPLDPNAMPVIVQAAQGFANKLVFTPASKDGRPVPSETTLVLTLGFEAQNGGFGVNLQRAQNGPSVVALGKANAPKTPRSNGAVIVVGADLRADGSIDIDTFKVEKAELRVPSEFDQSQYEKAARTSLKDTRFMLDKVDGIEIPSRLSVPFLFNGGAAKRPRGEREEDMAKDREPALPALSATSKIEGVVLPRIDYTAPPKH